MTAFLVLLLAYTISQFDRGFLAMVAPDLGPDLGLAPSDLALLSAGWFLAFAVGQVPTGLLLDRIGPRRTVAGFLVLAALGAGLLGLAQGFAGAACAMALIGLGCAPALMGGLYLFGRSYPPERFAMLSSLMIGLGTSGDLLGSTPLALASHAFGWRTILFGLALVTLAAAGLILWLIADPPRLADPAKGSGKGSDRTSVWRGFADVARMRALWPVFPVVFVSYAVVIATRSLWVGSYLGAVHGLDALQRGNGTLAMSAAMAAGAIGYGPLERLVRDPKRTAFAGCLVTGLALSGLGVFGSGSTALAVALLALTGAAGLSYGILMAHARRFFPAHLLGRGVAFMNIVFMGGAAAIQGLSALFVLETGGLGPDALYGRLFLAYGLALLAATAVYAAAPREPAFGSRASGDPERGTTGATPPPPASAPAAPGRGARA
ncbi:MULTISPECIES: MFS transporter [Methylobacterium]|jgi:MFS family permease|uniref:MFS transporter n=1 Tax=Methylobacterium TaxID=407 RepID=UPI0008E39C4F|nr:MULTISPECIES: MFS transporter [Methylobacterium]MBZ6415954.1 MFS transporter [Methylobacterium sp.]MBK3399519.1 MFS transporter [Methylobacterium ajmalii]MBK3411554.1 MFS transporter [Methylobacterium ajmalii]MBK3423085.1 MFS transporter [Methylobacterium ajmalii]SFF33003.1 Sugar phosphate permease [Methylobacterium sp. yr596]